MKVKLTKKLIATALFAAAIVLTGAIIFFAYLTSPQYIPYSSDLFSLTEINGVLIYTFNDEVTGISLDSFVSEDRTTDVYFINAWKTAWDGFVGRHRGQQLIISPIDGRQIAVYYSQQDGTEDILIYGSSRYASSPNESVGVITLPRLVLGYYLILAIASSIILMILLVILRKKRKIRLWIERIILFPISYVISHLCVMGLKGQLIMTYSVQRDFLFIMLITIPIYLAVLLGVSVLRKRRNI